MKCRVIRLIPLATHERERRYCGLTAGQLPPEREQALAVRGAGQITKGGTPTLSFNAQLL
ncbi:MAG: hypothetical protein NVS4B6_27770 [Mycobacterium sp.]